MATVGLIGSGHIGSTVARLAVTAGYDTVDAGTLADSWRYQPDTPAYGVIYTTDPQTWEHESPADADTLRSALAAATR
ncbi:hypothetical protein ACTMS0_07455 [Micromonospora sp. H33]|uniref:hypothetical protein n=1 Tax=Micromonospora sp. H33 TaxID=3452215 RepID=UPI003F8904CF